ncbi:hypothetical protein LCGC14_2186870, partial [marine sediment metagenome]
LWSAAELVIQMEDALREVSEYSPHVTMDTMEFESRTGADTAGTSGSLTDTDKSQFLSTDVGKVIYNTDDRTYAIVVTFTSTSVLVLSADIMDSGENYRMYNQDCWNINQLYVGGVEDFVGTDNGVKQVEYPIGEHPPKYRSFTVENLVLTVDYRSGIPDSGTANANIEVNVWFDRKHQVNQLTDLAGEVDLPAGGNAAGISTIHIDGMGASDVLVEDSEFTIAGLRGLYRLTDASTMSSNEGDINFYPPLQNAILDGDAITFVSSTLSRSLERQVVEFTAGRATISKGALLLREANSAITSVASSATALGLVAAKVLRQLTDLSDGRIEASKVATSLADGVKEIDNMGLGIDQATAMIDEGRGLANKVNVGGAPSVTLANLAAQALGASRARTDLARGYYNAAAGSNPVSNTYVALGNGQLAGANTSLGEAAGYAQKAVTELAIVDRTGEFRRWGERKMARILQQLNLGLPPNQRRDYPSR